MWDSYNKQWFMSDDAIVVVINLLREHQCQTVLEYGTNVGYLASKLSEFNVTSIECDDRFYAEAKKNCPHAILYHGTIEDVAPTLGHYDAVILDAQKGQYLEHFKLALSHTPKLIIADNVISHEKRLADFLEMIQSYNHEIIEVGDGLAIIHPAHTHDCL